MPHVVAALYRFNRFPEPEALRAPLAALCADAGVRGTLLLATEGINGTIAGSRAGVDAVVAHVRGLPGCADVEVKESAAPALPFGRMKVRVKHEIVSLGIEADPVARTGTAVAARAWDALIREPDVAVIDTRNAYEVAIGSFEGAIDPGTARFGDFPRWWRENAARFRDKRVAMFCTGGIRCEKASSFLLGEGVGEVFQLRGGILSYLETVPREQSLWRGACFVFDGRVSVGHGLAPGGHGLCHACGGAISAADRAHPAFEAGVMCPACIDAFAPERRAGFRERQRQMRLAAGRGERHLAPR